MSSSNDGPSNPQKSETRLVTAGRDTKAQKGFVNPPVVHGSTVLYPTADDLHAHRSVVLERRHVEQLVGVGEDRIALGHGRRL